MRYTVVERKNLLCEYRMVSTELLMLYTYCIKYGILAPFHSLLYKRPHTYAVILQTLPCVILKFLLVFR